MTLWRVDWQTGFWSWEKQTPSSLYSSVHFLVVSGHSNDWLVSLTALVPLLPSYAFFYLSSWCHVHLLSSFFSSRKAWWGLKRLGDNTFISFFLRLSSCTLQHRQPQWQQQQLKTHTHHPRKAHSTSSKHTQQQLQSASLALPNNPSISLERELGGGWKGVLRGVRVL